MSEDEDTPTEVRARVVEILTAELLVHAADLIGICRVRCLAQPVGDRPPLWRDLMSIS